MARRVCLAFLMAGSAAILAGCSQPDGAPPATEVSATYASDTALSCKQILSEIQHENMVIKQASADASQTSSTGTLNQSGNGSPVVDVEGAANGLPPTSSGEASAQLAADQTGTGAVARAKALVTLGKQKKCFL